jgi:Rrf2 family protein
MVTLAAHGDEGPISLETLATEQDIPERYLAKITQDLRRSGLIRSQRGAHGGYAINGDASDITLLDIWEALEGPVRPVACLDNEECRREPECVTRDIWARFQEALEDVLGSANLADLAEQYREQHAEVTE